MSTAKTHATEKYVYCPVCDYNLHGLDDGNCPECGTPFEREKLKLSRVGRKETFKDVVGTLLGWPFMVWLAVVPAVGMVLLPIVMLLIVTTGSRNTAIICVSLALLCVFGIVLFYTFTICRDLGRQAHRILRARNPDGSPWSAFRLFWFFFIFELFAILIVPGFVIAWGFVMSL
ncbi:MAG: hypothetical protein ACPG4Q_14305 [Phycisphaeraceae bacterium]